MPIIVAHTRTSERFIYLGSGMGAFLAIRENKDGGWRHRWKREKVRETVITVADADGMIHVFPPEELRVVEADGKTPYQVLTAGAAR